MNPWIRHLKAYRAKHPGVSLGDAMKRAKSTYKKTVPVEKKKKKRKTKKK
jgi:hypothetical protein